MFCNDSINDVYDLGPLNDISLLSYELVVPSSQTLPTFPSHEYVKLIAVNGNLSPRSDFDLPTREKRVELFRSIHKLSPIPLCLGHRQMHPNFRCDLDGGRPGSLIGKLLPFGHCGLRSVVFDGLRGIGNDSYSGLIALETSPTILTLRTLSYEHFFRM